MTNREYIKAVLSKFNLSENEIEIIILDNKIGSDDDVDVLKCKEAIHKNLTTWLPIHSSISEGGVSESWNYDAVKMYYSALCKELGLENAIDDKMYSIRDKSNLW